MANRDDSDLKSLFWLFVLLFWCAVGIWYFFGPA